MGSRRIFFVFGRVGSRHETLLPEARIQQRVLVVGQCRRCMSITGGWRRQIEFVRAGLDRFFKIGGRKRHAAMASRMGWWAARPERGRRTVRRRERRAAGREAEGHSGKSQAAKERDVGQRISSQGHGREG